MKIKEIRDKLIESGIETNEALREAQMLVEEFCNLSNKDIAINPEFESNEKLEQALKLRCEKRLPIQYIIEKAYFMGEFFKVNKNVLIPRDETEILVRKAITIIKENEFKTVLDIGTGSGCISCIIAKNTTARVLGIDLSKDALSIALDNSSSLNLYNRAVFRKSDLFSNVHEKFDLIISNPPYIPIKDREKLQVEIKFEPELALFTNDEKGVDFYDRITSIAGNYLNEGGYLMFELGDSQSEIVKEIFNKNNFTNIEIIKDLAYIDRVIIGKKK